MFACLLKPMWLEQSPAAFGVCSVFVYGPGSLAIKPIHRHYPHIWKSYFPNTPIPVEEKRATQDRNILLSFSKAEQSWPCLDKVQQIVDSVTVGCLLPHTSEPKKENADEESWSHSTESRGQCNFVSFAEPTNRRIPQITHRPFPSISH